MAYGDQTITYPFSRGPIARGSNNNTVMWIETVESGPTQVGGTEPFVIRIDYAGVARGNDPLDSYVFPQVSTDFSFAMEYVDYGARMIRQDINGSLYAPPGTSSFTRSFSLPAGWQYIEIAGTSFGHQYDPRPFGEFVDEVIRLWNGATFTVTATGPVTSYDTHGGTYAERARFGADAVAFAFTGSETTFRVQLFDGADQPIPFFDPDTFYTTIAPGSNYINPPLGANAPSSTRRIHRVTVYAATSRRSGSYFASWYFGTLPGSPLPGGGGEEATPGGTAVQKDIVRGAIRGAQSGMHQRFVRVGGATTLSARAGGAPGTGSGSGSGGVSNA